MLSYTKKKYNTKKSHNIKKNNNKKKYNTKKHNKKNTKQIAGGIILQDIELWFSFNRIANSLINYKIFLDDKWKTDVCNFNILGNKKKEINDPKDLKTLESRIKDCKNHNGKDNNNTDKCVVTPSSDAKKFRCHLKNNYYIFKEGSNIEMQDKNKYTLINIGFPNINIQKGGEDMIRYVYLEKMFGIINDDIPATSTEILEYIRERLLKYLQYGSFLFYLREDKKKLVINFPFYSEPYIFYLRTYMEDTKLTTEPIVNNIKLHNGFNELIKLHIDNIDTLISQILNTHTEIEEILFTGHSFGASAIQLIFFYLLEIKNNTELKKKLSNVKIITTGAIRLGNKEWTEWWERRDIINNIFNFCFNEDTFAITPGVQSKNTKKYTSESREEFYPIHPKIIIVNNLDRPKSKYSIATPEQIKTFTNTHFDFMHHQSDVWYHNLDMYAMLLIELYKRDNNPFNNSTSKINIKYTNITNKNSIHKNKIYNIAINPDSTYFEQNHNSPKINFYTSASN